MPCDGGSGPNDSYQDLKKRFDELAQLLCEICTTIDKTGNHHLKSDKLSEWWTEHKKQDKARQDAERFQLYIEREKKIAKYDALIEQLDALKKELGL